MQRFLARDAKFSYSPGHASIGTVEPGETFEVESVEGFYNSFVVGLRLHARALCRGREAEVGRDRADHGRRREAGDAVAVTIHSVEVTTPGVVVYGGYTAEEPYEWWDDESACAVYPARGRLAALRRAHDAADTPADRLPGRRPGRGRVARQAPGPLRRQPRLPRDPRRRHGRPARGRTTAAGSTSATARRSWATARSSGPPRSARS